MCFLVDLVHKKNPFFLVDLRPKLKYLKINPKTTNWLKKVVQMTIGAIITFKKIEKSSIFVVDLLSQTFHVEMPIPETK